MASRLHGPPPAAARNRKRKQLSTASSPPLTIGQKAFGAWPIALVFGLANLVLLTIRITVESRALATARQPGG